MQVSIANYSELERTKRIDAEFFWPVFLSLHEVLSAKKVQPLTTLCHISDGNHMSVASHFQRREGIPYFRGKDINTDFFIENANPIFIPESVYTLPYMKRSWFQEGDILLSIVGTIGSLSIVTDKIKKSTGSCKIAILRAKKNNNKYIASFLKSKYGQFQIKRNTRGAVQQGLLLEDMDQIQVYIPEEEFEKLVSRNIEMAISLNRLSQEIYTQAQDLFLSELGLKNWQPKHHLTFVKNYSDTEQAGRIDSEYYQPKYEKILSALWNCGGMRLCEIASVKKGYQARSSTGTVPYASIKDISGNLVQTNEFSEHSNNLVEMGFNDLALAITGATIGKVGMNISQQKIAICGDLLKITAKSVSSYYLLVFLGLPIITDLCKRNITGMTNGHLSPDIVKRFPVPILNKKVMEDIGEKAIESFNLRKQSKHLLECAKRAVEMAIDQDEETAMNWLKNEIGEMQLGKSFNPTASCFAAFGLRRGEAGSLPDCFQ